MLRRLIVLAPLTLAVTAIAPLIAGAWTGGGIVTPTTSSTTGPVIVLPTTSTTTLPPSFTTTTTTSPVIVVRTTTTTTTTTSTTTTPPPIPTVPPVIGSSTPTTHPDPPQTTNPGNIAISTTSSVLGEAVPEGETVPDVFVRGVEVTQGIQDLQSRMPLVAGRRTTVRVHIGVSGGYVGSVDGALLVERPGHGDVVLHPDNGPIPPGLDRTELDGALNFELDADLYAEGDATFTAQVWSAAGIGTIADEPDPDNNLRTEHVEFPCRLDPDGLADRARRRRRAGRPDRRRHLTARLRPDGERPTCSTSCRSRRSNFQAYPLPVGPGAEAAVPGTWDVSLDIDVDPTANARRNEPNIRMNEIATAGGFLDDGLVLGLFDNSVPQGDYSGWAKFGVSWNFASAGTPAHEAAHSVGLDHVNCLGDTDGDGISQEDEGGVDRLGPPEPAPTGVLAGADRSRRLLRVHELPHAHRHLQQRPGAPAQAAFPFMGYTEPEVDRPVRLVPDARHVRGSVRSRRRSGCRRCRTSWTSTARPRRSARPSCISTSASASRNRWSTPRRPVGGVAVAVGDVDGRETLLLTGEQVSFAVPLEPDEWVMVGRIHRPSGRRAH